MKLAVASKNKGKLDEIKYFMKDLCYDVVSMEEEGIYDDFEETGTTFEENALIKARELHKIIGGMVMADDSGFEVEYLGGKPGVLSARFAGPGASDHDKNIKILGMLKGVPKEERKVAFVCVIAVIMPDGTELLTRGKCEGVMTDKPIGNGGFGYDPIVLIESLNKTVAQLSKEEKTSIGHRGKALRKMAERLENY